MLNIKKLSPLGQKIFPSKFNLISFLFIHINIYWIIRDIKHRNFNLKRAKTRGNAIKNSECFLGMHINPKKNIFNLKNNLLISNSFMSENDGEINELNLMISDSREKSSNEKKKREHQTMKR